MALLASAKLHQTGLIWAVLWWIPPDQAPVTVLESSSAETTFSQLLSKDCDNLHCVTVTTTGAAWVLRETFPAMLYSTPKDFNFHVLVLWRWEEIPLLDIGQLKKCSRTFINSSPTKRFWSTSILQIFWETHEHTYSGLKNNIRSLYFRNIRLKWATPLSLGKIQQGQV